MPAVVSMLRGVNVGGHNPIKMEALRALYESLGLGGAQTYIQSGNVVFQAKERDSARLAERIGDAIQRDFGFHPGVVVRTCLEMREAMAKNPFPIVVPCHRVLAAGKKAGGFSAHGGAETKRKMLAIEGVTLAVPAETLSLFDGDRAAELDPDEVVRALSAADRALARVIEKVGPLGLQVREMATPFQALAQSIVYQQLTGKAAATILGRVHAIYGGRRRFTPAALLETKDDALRLAGLSRAKTAALKDLAAKTIDGTVPAMRALAKLSDDAIVERLTVIRGIGRWTVEMLLIFRLGRRDVLPVDDYGVRKGLQRALRTKELPTRAQLAERGERWRPYRSAASWYLWRACELP